jgi:hypothetical protein
MTLMTFIYMYYGLFACINLVYICFSWFFSFHLLIFGKIYPISDKIRPKIATMNFEKNCWFNGEVGRLITKIGRISVFWISTSHPSSPGVFRSIFPEFCQKNSNFYHSVEFLNTGHGSPPKTHDLIQLHPKNDRITKVRISSFHQFFRTLITARHGRRPLHDLFQLQRHATPRTKDY